METYSVENMALSHLDDIMEIEALCYGKHHWSRESFASELNNSCARHITAITADKKCVGYMAVGRIFAEAHVTNLAVHAGYPGQGLWHVLVLSSLDMCDRDTI